MLQDLVIIGGGEHAGCVFDAARLSGNFNVLGFLDREKKNIKDLPYLGGDDAAAAYAHASFIVGVGMIGPGRGRKLIADKMTTVRSWATIVHPKAIVSPRAVLGIGVLIMPGAIINAGATIGDHCIVNSGAVIEHDCRIGAFSHLCPGVVMGGGVIIGENSVIGLGARIRDHVTIGAFSFVAMASVVTKSFPEHSRVLGHPATPGWDFS